ncbi:MAG: HNH endonuclease [Bacteroidia bacterium]|nr:HNH endonuclease [Bacteroidia bacterium]
MVKKKFWTTTEIRYIRENLHLTDKQLADRLGRTFASVKTCRHRYFIIKPEDHWHFNQNNQPYNKGKHYSAGGRSVETRFKLGNQPHNTRNDYDISIRRNKKTGICYKYIRLSKFKWVLMHRWIWETQYGVIPPGHVITFKDKDPMNCTLDNLECITRKELVSRNHNRAKASVSMKKHWDWCRTKETFGIKTVRHNVLKVC